jgi:hypothetical protein
MTLFIQATSPDGLGSVEKNIVLHDNNNINSSSLHTMFFEQDSLQHWLNLDKDHMLI